MTKTNIKLITINALLSLAIVLTVHYGLQTPKAPLIEAQVANTGIVEGYSPDLCGLDTVVCDNELTNQIVYGYSSSENETDSDPFTTANGEKVRDGGIANNCLPFGTSVTISGKIYTVNDRLNKRYGCEVWAAWHESKEAAKKWGKQITNVTVL